MMHAVLTAPHTSTESNTVAPELSVRISHGLKAAVSRNDNVSPPFACTAYSFACLPGRCGAPQSLSAIALVSITSGVMVFSTHGMIVYVTCTLSGDPLAPGAAKAIVLRCVPTARPVGLSVARTTVDVTSLGGTVLPESESVTQVVSNVAVQANGRAPGFLICKEKVSGCAFPTNAVVTRDVVSTSSSAAAGRMKNLSGTRTESLVWVEAKTIVSWCSVCDSVSGWMITSTLSGVLPEYCPSSTHTADLVAVQPSVGPSAFW